MCKKGPDDREFLGSVFLSPAAVFQSQRMKYDLASVRSLSIWIFITLFVI